MKRREVNMYMHTLYSATILSLKYFCASSFTHDNDQFYFLLYNKIPRGIFGIINYKLFIFVQV